MDQKYEKEHRCGEMYSCSNEFPCLISGTEAYASQTYEKHDRASIRKRTSLWEHVYGCARALASDFRYTG